MKTIKSSCSSYLRQYERKKRIKIFATARGYGELKGGWGSFLEEKSKQEKLLRKRLKARNHGRTGYRN